MKRTIRWGLWAIVAVAILWTGVWFGARWWLGDTLHKSIADLSARNGIIVDCAGEKIGGWPFELTVNCGDGLTVALPDGGKFTTAGAHGKGSAFNPRQLDFRFEAPTSYTAPDGRRLALSANELAASVGLANGLANRLALTTRDLTATGPLAGATEGKLTIGRGELLLARATKRPEDADIAATLDGFGVAVGDTALMPLPIRLTLAATLAEADMATAGPAALAGWQAAGGKLTLHRLAAELGGATLTLTGEGTVSETGLVEAEGQVTGRDLNALAVAAAAGGRSLTPEIAGLVMAFVFMGSAADDGGRSIGLKVTDGVVSANGREIARLAPLF
ncbi:hypothetical protein KL86PLE_60468 [uncultured Pleomorphomonas sp.]|uniref:DUF2125 domain-containing protein n=1 Tax=uncultured Pleomorphomonas sp. TaxID=442121 RepID=A0A212LKT8_9HYPH|nr:DUF2125 domain-containing protein [uncultured Pleomorphomonas sp.]SCM78146.1 hypothetical protein KL86PLE_60468 [uncultured Pleomorphomonas sp.]